MRGTGNKYVYADNHPLSNVDLYGLSPIEVNYDYDGGIDFSMDMPLEIGESHAPLSFQTGAQLYTSAIVFVWNPGVLTETPQDQQGRVAEKENKKGEPEKQAQNQGEGSQANVDRRDAIAGAAVDAKERADLGQKQYGPNQCSAFVAGCISKAGADAKFTPDDGPPRAFVAGEWANKKTDIPGWTVLGPNEKPAPGDVAAVSHSKPALRCDGRFCNRG